MRDPKGCVVAVATLQGGVYRSETVEDQACAAKEHNEVSLWHRRLGHLNRGSMDLLRKGLAEGLEGCTIERKRGKICGLGKSSKLPFKGEGKRASGLLNLIHSDICGPMSVNSIGGARYMLTFIDDYSRKKFVYFIKEKSQAAQTFEQFKARVENKLNGKIKIFRTINGKEYINSTFREILQRSGIVHQATAPYTSEQNRVAERTNRTIVEMVRSMLIDAGLPKKF